MKSKYGPEERALRNKAKAKEWREANRGRLRDYMAVWRAENHERLLEWGREWRKRNPRRWRPRILAKQYGWTPEDYRNAVVGQAGRCLVCHRVPPKDLVVDHDHATGQVRGLLCDMCNRMLGHAQDRVDNFRAAIRYLEGGA